MSTAAPISGICRLKCAELPESRPQSTRQRDQAQPREGHACLVTPRDGAGICVERENDRTKSRTILKGRAPVAGEGALPSNPPAGIPGRHRVGRRVLSVLQICRRYQGRAHMEARSERPPTTWLTPELEVCSEIFLFMPSQRGRAGLKAGTCASTAGGAVNLTSAEGVR